MGFISKKWILIYDSDGCLVGIKFYYIGGDEFKNFGYMVYWVLSSVLDENEVLLRELLSLVDYNIFKSSGNDINISVKEL